MIAEVWKANFRVLDILNSIQEAQKTISIKEFSNGYQGWSVLSEDGSPYKGWNEEAVVLDENGEMNLRKSYEKKIELGLNNDRKHIVPTPLMTPELEEVYQIISSKGLNPCRMRISVLKAGSSLYWHSDAPADTYSVRLHIPLITNPQAFFETEKGREHFPANGDAYFIKVNNKHRVINSGITDRWHLIMDVTDQDNFTQFHSLRAHQDSR